MIEINKNPSKRELMWFGVLFALFFALIGGLVWWKCDSPSGAWSIWWTAAGVVAVYYVVPPLRKWLYLGWMYAAFPIGWTISHVVLALVYYLVFTPIGLIMRLLGHDPLHRKFDRQATTYWTPHDPSGEARAGGRYFRQF